MQKYWNTVLIQDIAVISKGGGSFSKDKIHIYFTVIMKNGEKHHFHYNSREGYEERNELKKLFNEVNNVPETYLLENNIYVEVDGNRLVIGCRVENNLDNYEYLTNTQIKTLKKQGKIQDEDWRHLVYICPLMIQNKKVIHGKLTDEFKQELDALGIEYETQIL